MKKMIAYPKDNLEMDVHTWTKGLDYEAIEKSDYIALASNQGSANFTGKAQQELHTVFDFVEGE